METQHTIIDTDLALERAGGNTELAKELFSMLLKELPVYREKIAQTFSSQDLEQLQYDVHKLNGSATYCATVALKAEAESLENDLKKGNLGSLERQVSGLCHEIDRVMEQGPSIYEQSA